MKKLVFVLFVVIFLGSTVAIAKEASRPKSECWDYYLGLNGEIIAVPCPK